MTTKTVEVNGVLYDAHTGLPVDAAPKQAQTSKPSAPKKPLTPAARVHTSTQKSQTLRRSATKKPTPTTKSRAQASAATPRRSMDIARSSSIKRFAPHPAGSAKKAAPITAPADIPPVTHPFEKKAHIKMATPKPTAKPKSAQTIKQEAITEALAKPKPKVKKKGFFKRHPRIFSVASASLVVIVIAAYFTYLNMPSLSVRVAAAQAGVAASYPDYRPDGYSINGPVTYNDNVVHMTFSANMGKTSYVITQAKSTWDSSAVREKVDKDSNGQFITTKEKGLTVYTYNGNASWVNGGILYTISGDAPLSSDQILRIALSL